MISIKKYLEMAAQPAATDPARSADPEGIVAALVQAYRSTIDSMGNNGARACPAVGSELQHGLAELQRQFDKALSSTLAVEIEKLLSGQLDQWGGRASEYFKAKTGEIKELLVAVARMAESMGARDQRYSQQLGEFTLQLQTIADLDDLALIRSSLVRKASELKICVDQMAEENRKAITQLTAEVSGYEKRLREAETLAAKDDLTGLLNRRSVESRLEAAIEAKRPFCVVILDLNAFKQVNDTYGHAAGDSLLTQFAGELRTNIRASHGAGRWGGDEFVLLLDCDLKTARAQIERIEKWAFGEYTLAAGTGREPLKLQVRASVGVAEWAAGMTPSQLIERADQDMYREKKMARKQNA
jgi:diguanylate cyclase (GGDEF)-like protein